MTRTVLLSVGLMLVVGLAWAQVAPPAGTGPVPGHGIPVPIYVLTGGGGVGGPPPELYAPVPPHGITVVYVPGTGPVPVTLAPGGGGGVLPVVSKGGTGPGGVVPSHGTGVYPPGTQDNTGGGGGSEGGNPAPVTASATLLYPDFSPQGMIDAVRRGDGWPWNAPPAFRTAAMQKAGVTAAWQALEAYRRLFAELPAADWTQAGQDSCKQGLQLLSDRVGQPLFSTPSAFLWAEEQIFADLRAGAWSGPVGHTAHAEDEAAPPPDPAVWAIWALNLGAVQGTESALALDQILGCHLTDAAGAKARDRVGRLPGGPRYLAGLELRTGAGPLAQQALATLAGADPVLLKSGIQPLAQAAQHAGYYLVGATLTAPDQAQLLLASSLESGQAWCVTAYLRSDLALPAAAGAPPVSLPDGARDHLKALLAQATGKPAPRLEIDCFTQVTTPTGQGALWKLEAGKWEDAGKAG